jgi:hypothetical protein
LLCRAHHRAVHEGGWQLARGPRWALHRHTVTANPPIPPSSTFHHRHRRTPRWAWVPCTDRGQSSRHDGTVDRLGSAAGACLGFGGWGWACWLRSKGARGSPGPVVEGGQGDRRQLHAAGQGS